MLISRTSCTTSMLPTKDYITGDTAFISELR